ESEYRYLLKDLGLVSTRPIDFEIDGSLTLGGDGPGVRSLVSKNLQTKMFFLTNIGERLVDLYLNNRSFYEDYLFWLILRNHSYLPLLQQLIIDPESYSSDHIEKLIRSGD